MSRGEAASLILAKTRAEEKDITNDDLINDQANGANISTYDDPPLDQLDEIEDGSFSVEENPWRGEDPPEEVPHDEYIGSEYDDDMPDDEMASRTGDGLQETRAEDRIQEEPRKTQRTPRKASTYMVLLSTKVILVRSGQEKEAMRRRRKSHRKAGERGAV